MFMRKLIDELGAILYCTKNRKEFLAEYRMGSINYVDAEILYTLVQHYQPKRVLEFGTFLGCSAAIMARAMRESGNKNGTIDTVDSWSETDNQYVHSWLLPDESRQLVKGQLLTSQDKRNVFVITDTMQHYLSILDDETQDIVFEDTDHKTETLIEVTPELLRVLKPGGTLLFHDTAMPEVMEGIRTAGIANKMSYFYAFGSGIGGMFK